MFSTPAVRQLNSLSATKLASFAAFHIAATRHALQAPSSSVQVTSGRKDKREFENPRSRPERRVLSRNGPERRQPSRGGFERRAPPRNNVSTRSTRPEGGTAAGSDVPRYIRRQGLGDEKARDVARTKRGAEAVEDMHKPLDPYILAKRLRLLCEDNKIEDAVAMLQNAPRDAMNTIVWNSMIWEAMKVERFQLAHSLYVDMKRRGLSPTTRTYQTMFAGLSRIERWNTYPKQLANARSLYDDFQRHITSLKKHEPYSPDITSTPLAGYFKILGNVGEYQEIFDVYYALDPEGPYSANEFVYTAVFQALAGMRHALNGRGITAPSHWGAKVASDARMMWNYMLKASKEKSPGLADSYAATAAISALSQGEKVDHDLAFDIAHNFFGLSRDETKKVRGLFPLSRQSLGAILKLCNEAGEHSTCLHFFQLVKRSTAVGILDRPHVEEVLKARYQLQSGGMGSASLQLLEWMLQRERGDHGPQIRPATSTYNLVLSACWKGVDWPSVTVAFNLMTGHHPEDFSDEAIASGMVPQFDKRERGRNIRPSVETMSSMMRTAVATRQRSNIRACMRLIDHVGLLPRKASSSELSNREMKNQLFFASKLAQTVNEGWELIKGYANECGKDEFQSWRALKDKCNREYNHNQKQGYTPTKLT